MKTIKFILQKIVIVEFMLILLVGSIQLFHINMLYIYSFLTTSLHFLTPIAIFSLIGYIILSILTKSFLEILLGIAISGIILYYLSIHI